MASKDFGEIFLRMLLYLSGVHLRMSSSPPFLSHAMNSNTIFLNYISSTLSKQTQNISKIASLRSSELPFQNNKLDRHHALSTGCRLQGSHQPLLQLTFEQPRPDNTGAINWRTRILAGDCCWYQPESGSSNPAWHRICFHTAASSV